MQGGSCRVGGRESRRAGGPHGWGSWHAAWSEQGGPGCEVTWRPADRRGTGRMQSRYRARGAPLPHLEALRLLAAAGAVGHAEALLLKLLLQAAAHGGCRARGSPVCRAACVWRAGVEAAAPSRSARAAALAQAAGLLAAPMRWERPNAPVTAAPRGGERLLGAAVGPRDATPQRQPQGCCTALWREEPQGPAPGLAAPGVRLGARGRPKDWRDGPRTFATGPQGQHGAAQRRRRRRHRAPEP